MHYYSTYESPIGVLPIVATATHITALLWPSDAGKRVTLPEDMVQSSNPLIVSTKLQLDEYFNGMRTRFELPLMPAGTAFQQKVWQELLTIPYGALRTYGQLAKKLAQPSAARAVGAANGKNPISIIIPCHRVIGNNGALTGFAGGIAAKDFLLKLEGHLSLL